MYNKKGKNIEKSITVNNINKSKPSGSCSGSYKDGRSTINIKASDDIGISRYEIDGTSYTSNNITINKEIKTVNITIYDKANNSTSISCNLEDKNSYESSTVSPTNPPSSSTTKPTTAPSNSSAKYILNNHKNISLNYYVSSYNKGFSYWVYLPENMRSNLPIIMYMPGLGEVGNDYEDNSTLALSNGPINEVVSYGYKYNAIIVHVQVPYGDKVYPYLSSYIELMNKLANDYNANKKKISVMGFSHGCYGVMNIMQGNQTYFSAAVVIGCDPKDRAKYFVSTPTWAFAGSGDGVSTMPGFVDSINKMGGTAKFNRPSYHAHNVIGNDYSILRDNNYNVIDWMTSQTRK